MSKLIPALVLGLAVSVGPAQAQHRCSQEEAVAIAKSWYRRYLHREAEPSGLTGWVNNLRAGADRNLLLATFLGGDEYYAAAGKSAGALVRALFDDILRREPSRHEYQYWVRRLGKNTNQEMIYAFLLRYPAR